MKACSNPLIKTWEEPVVFSVNANVKKLPFEGTSHS